MTNFSVTMDRAAANAVSMARAKGNSPLKALRMLRGLTTRGLAGAARMDPAQLDLMEQQSELGAPILVQWAALAKALKVPIEAVR